MSRTIWRRAHPVRLPERSSQYAQIHTELSDAYRFDRLMEEMREQIAAEVERDLREAR